jgi:5'-3' exonuclease
MKTYILIDTYNLFFRALYTVNDADMELCKGLCLHTMINMIKKGCDKFKPDCLIACRDGNKSWRKEIYPLYKANRLEKLNTKTPFEIERENACKDVFENDLLKFIDEQTNIPLLSFPFAEADDLIARFIALHPNDTIIILSTDNDFVQLLNDNVFIYNSMEDRIISNKCIIDAETKKPLEFKLKDGKVSVPKEQPQIVEQLVPSEDWVEYALFTKCIRGDKSDNIFSAYPRVREKSTKTTIGMREAFLDMNNKGFNWVCFMNKTWTDAFGEEKLVEQEYNFNKKIIDLQMIPDELKNNIDNYIKEKINESHKSCVGINLIKFLRKWNLVNLETAVQSFSGYFQKGYTNE